MPGARYCVVVSSCQPHAAASCCSRSVTCRNPRPGVPACMLARTGGGGRGGGHMGRLLWQARVLHYTFPCCTAWHAPYATAVAAQCQLGVVVVLRVVAAAHPAACPCAISSSALPPRPGPPRARGAVRRWWSAQQIKSHGCGGDEVMPCHGAGMALEGAARCKGALHACDCELGQPRMVMVCTRH